MGFLLFGTIWFWIVLVALSGGIIYALENALADENEDNGGGAWATALVIGFVIAYYFFGSKEDVINILTYVRDHPFQILGFFGAYVFAGVVWAFVKWYFYVHSRYEKSKAEKERYHNRTLVVPTASDNKFRIMSWMYYWPFSGIWTMINEPLKKSFNYAYAKIGGTFDKISKHMFSDLIKQDEQKKAEQEAIDGEIKQRKNRQVLNEGSK